MSLIVSDTTPLNYLILIGQIDVLSRGILTIGTIAILDLADESKLLDFELAITNLQATSFHVESALLEPVLAKVRARKKA